MKNLIYIAGICLIFLSSCTKDQGPLYDTSIISSDTVSFQYDIQPIFNANCAGCHNASNTKLKLISGYSYNQLLFDGFEAPYVDTINPELSKLYKYITGESALMPPTGEMDGENINLIYNWIRQGAKNN
jgi:hypothetical protein